MDFIAAEGNGYGTYIQFKEGEVVLLKVASSYISLKQAELNLSTDLGADKTLEQIKTRAAEIWNKSLNKIKVEGDSEADKETFYSSLTK